MEDGQSVRDQIIYSLFRKTREDGLLEETYVSHLKIWEDVPPAVDTYSEELGMKARYLFLSLSATGRANFSKGKRNHNGTFSIGKRWALDEVRILETPNSTNIWVTLARIYKWRTEREQEQINFVIATSHLAQRLGLQIAVTGVQVPPLPSIKSRRSEQNVEAAAAQVATAPTPAPSAPSRRRPVAAEAVASSPPLTTANFRPPARPTSSSSYGSSPGGGRNTTFSLASQTTSIPTRSRTPVGSSLRPSSGASRSPKISTVLPPPTPPPNVPALPEPQQRSSRSRSTTPVPPNGVLQPNDSNSTFAANQTLRASHTSSTPSSRPNVSREPSNQGPAARDRGYDLEPERQTIQANLPPPQNNGIVSQPPPPSITTNEALIIPDTSFAQALNNLHSPSEDYGFEATMANVEEMIDGFEWSEIQVNLDHTSISTTGGSAKPANRKRTRGAADQIQARLQDELSALEKANIHSFLESDDRVLAVMRLVDEAVTVIDDIDGYISSYKTLLNSVADDISYIQSRDRGLQVQTQNQNALLNVIEQLLETVHVETDRLLVLTQGSLETDGGIQLLEETAAELYKAMQAARENDMVAMMERLEEYRTYNTQFTSRLTSFLTVMFSAQAALLSKDSDAITAPLRGPGRSVTYPRLPSHQVMEDYIGRYAGLILYAREMDEARYSKICATYFSVVSDLHGREMRTMMTSYLELSKKSTDDAEDFAGFSPTTLSRMNTQLRRTNTTKSPLDAKKDKAPPGSISASEAFSRALGLLTPQIYREETFIADLLQIHDGAADRLITFADYMQLESYFRRQAARTLTLGGSTKQLVRGALELIFGFLPESLKVWVEGALSKDGLQLIGIIAVLERFIIDAEERGNAFVQKLLQKQLHRMSGLFTKLVDEQIRAVEQTKLTTKKRKGVVYFVRYFPIFVSKIETQLIGADTLDVRALVDGAYEQIVQVMFESLQQMAKMSDQQAGAGAGTGAAGGGEEDKGVLNFHVILIENMHYFLGEIAQQELGAMQAFLRRAQAIYDDNLSAYVKLVMRRPMGKILDFFDGIERLLKTTAPSQVAFSSAFSKSALKRVVKEYSSKDMRRHIEALYKRVDKHFTLDGVDEGGSTLRDVWKACEEEMVRHGETFSRLIAQCYEGVGVQLEFTPTELESYFKMVRRGK